MNITVYLGSSKGNHPCYEQFAKELGTYLAQNGHTLVYGGSCTGLMGILAETVLAQGVRVVGVETRFFVEKEMQQPGLSRLLITKTMAERKAKMLELGDVFLAFPGGVGTLEEISEVMAKQKLGLITKPFAFLDVNGFYQPLKAALQQMVQEGFLGEDWFQDVPFLSTLEQVAQFIAQAAPLVAE